jgi:hypothetical protein
LFVTVFLNRIKARPVKSVLTQLNGITIKWVNVINCLISQ